MLARGESSTTWRRELRELYATLAQVNRALALRMRGIFPGDAGVNAIIRLFSLSALLVDHIEDDALDLAGLLDHALCASE